MSQTSHTFPGCLTASRAMLGAAVLIALLLGASLARLPREPAAAMRVASQGQDTIAWPDPALGLKFATALVFQAPPGGQVKATDSLATRFRLAGTFVESGGAFDTRKAVLDDRRSGQQIIASEGDSVSDVDIVRITPTSVVLRDAHGNQEAIHLSFTDSHGLGPRATGEGGSGSSLRSGFESDAEAFQIKQVGENSWIFQRERILDYYRELSDEPERLLKVFDSMKPERNEAGAIEGYRLIVEGEAEFFRAAGLRENDIVRSVNRRKLSNRRIAEAFIADFITDQASAFILEVEREGKTEQLLYQMR